MTLAPAAIGEATLLTGLLLFDYNGRDMDTALVAKISNFNNAFVYAIHQGVVRLRKRRHAF